MMRNIFFIFLMAFIFSCNSGKSTATKTSSNDELATSDTIRIENKELEYEIIIIEIGFDAWLATQRPQSYFTQPYLEIRNTRYVSEYNYRVTLPGRYNTNIYNQMIDYEPHIDYGMEVNYLLYMYFEYFQKKYRQNLW